ncbi:MAG TPA: thioredoxin domain-containing protein [Solirubrobacterales bacterium]|nr:thioredoxin domain-containing protein [Solirubrobacterales bacterium]
MAAVVASSGGSSSRPHRLTIPQEPDAGKRTYALLLGIPQHDSTLGYRNAPVTLQFFGDLQCIDSRRVMLGALPFLIRHWVRAGKLQIVFRSTETDTKHAGGWYEFREQQSAALAAGKQGKLWNFIDVFYRDQGPEFTGYVDEGFLRRIAEVAGVDMERWKEARREDWVPQIETDETMAGVLGLVSTPSFLIGPTGGNAHPLLHFSYEEPVVFDEAIREELRDL